MFAWGANSHGQLGIGAAEDKHTPTRVPSSSEPDFIGAGGKFSVFVENSTIWASGQMEPKFASNPQNTFKLLDKVGESVKALSCGWDFFLVLTNSGKLYFRGHNSPGFTFNNDSVPYWVNTLSLVVSDVPQIKYVAAGLRHAVAVSDTEQVSEWRSGRFKSINTDNFGHIVGCVAGAHHSVVWTDDGCVGIWGDMRFGQGGKILDEVATPLRKTDNVQWISNASFNNERIVDVQSGWSHIIALTESGRVFSWGRSDFGQLGRPLIKSKPTTVAWPQIGCVFDPTPSTVSLPIASSIRSISAGAEHCLALMTEGQLWTWGWNEHGTCGIAGGNVHSPVEEGNVTLPRCVPFFQNETVRLVTSGYGHSMAFIDI